MQAADWIASVGVIVNGIFSFLVYRATRQSARVAANSFEMAQMLHEREQKSHRGEQVRWAVRAQASKVESALRIFHPRLLESAPRNPGVSNTDLAAYFTSEERQVMNNTWELYDLFLVRFWTDVAGNFKHGLSGEEIPEANKERDIVQIALQNLMRMIEAGSRYSAWRYFPAPGADLWRSNDVDIPTPL